MLVGLRRRVKRRHGTTHIDRKLAAYPSQLAGVSLKLLDPARVRFANVDGVSTKGINDLEVVLEHIRVLIIFGVDILPYCRGKRQLGRLAKREVEKVSNTLTVSSFSRVEQ